ncbi:MAG: TonB-dependent receptor [Prevotellaceae bacterium]|nr:TonB-dependent receptor [Prevotellaceae bacterium]
MRKIRVFLVCMVFAGTSVLSAQSVQVSGVVTDAADGQPLPGVSVVVKGANVSSATDANGRYTINVEGDATLVFTFIGMKTQEEAVGGRTVINVALEAEIKRLEDVVVVAYGTTTKERFTGSVATIKNDKIVQRQTSNVTQALSGQVAGVQTFSANGQPGTAATVRIRGFGSMSASNSPLYVIDGVPYDGTLSSINNADIESLSVLKDASASAIYGARGANGVILVTTKKGKTGEAVVTVDARVGSNSRAIPSYEVMTDPAMYYETFYKALYNSKVQAGSGIAEAHTYARNALLNADAGGLGYQVYTVPVGEYLIGANGKLNPKATLGYYDGEYYYTPDNWYDELFNRGNLRQEYNVSVSGATEKLRYYLSAGHLDDSGIIDGSSFSRWTTALNADYQAKKWLKVGTNLSYTNYNSKAPGGQTEWGNSGNLFYLSSLMAPIYPMYVRNADGSIKTDANGYTVYDFGSTTNQTRKFMPMANPAITLKLDKNNACTDVVTNKWFAIIDILEGLQFTSNIGLNVRNQRSSALSNMFYGAAVSAGGYVGVRHGQDIGLNQQYLLTYKRGFGAHNLDILAGYESYEYTVKGLSGSNKQLYNPDIAELNNTIFDIPSVSSNTSHYVTKGFLSRVQYDFHEKIFLSASYRRDASSRFAPEHRWGNFGSFGAAWNINKEEFFKDLNAGWIDLLKLKASYGIQGNDDLGNNYAYLDQYSVSNNGAGDFALTLSYKGNREITWETSYSFNTGIEFELFDQKLNGAVEYFNRKTVDLLYNQPVPLSLGYSSIPMNVGTIVNQGVELDINANILKTENIQWDVNLNATSLSNKITDLHENVRETGIKGSVRIYKVGGSLYNIFLREYAGVDPASGKVLYYKVDENNHYVLDTNGNKTTTDSYDDTYQVDLGNSLPWLFGGFGTTVDLFGFDISLAFSYQLGGKTFDMSYQQLMHTGYSSNAGANWHKDILNAWTPENPNTDVPRLNSSDNSDQQHSSRFLVSSDYLSLNNITVGYTFPQKWVKPLKISSLRVYFTADNVALLTARKGLDPRQSAGVASWDSVSSHIYTALRTISGGMTIKF